MLYELRIYQPYAGRMPDLLRRFRDQVPSLFARHGIDCVGLWMTASDTPQLAYLTRYSGYAEREKAWAAFGADPQWQAVRRDSNAGSEMLQGYELHYLKPKPGMTPRLATQHDDAACEFLFLATRHGQEAQVTEWLRTEWVPQLHAARATLLHCFDLVAGTQLPQSVLMIGWPDQPSSQERERAVEIRLPAGLAPMRQVQTITRRIALSPIR
jgi:hypothetical protein